MSGTASKKSLLCKVGKVKNTKIREIANKHVQRSKGDFGMTIEGGVDLEAFAEEIIKECSEVAAKRVIGAEDTDFGLVEECYNHFGVK